MLSHEHLFLHFLRKGTPPKEMVAEESISMPAPTQPRLLDPTKEKERQRSVEVSRALARTGRG